MRIGIATSLAYGVGIWKRFQEQGHEVLFWRGEMKQDSPHVMTSHRFVGQGIVPLTDSWYSLLAWCKEKPSILVFDSSGLGKLADMARKAGVLVVGGGSFCDDLEKKRSFGRSIAEQAGIQSPPIIEFATLDDCLDYARSGKCNREVYWKTDVYISGDATHRCDNSEELIEYVNWVKTKIRSNISCILEDKLDGTALSTNRWWNGRAWVGPYGWTIERKAFMPDEVGPKTGCSLNAVGFYEDDHPLIADALNWLGLTGAFRENQAPPGLYDINAIVQDGQAYFLEWTPRFGWDSEGTSHLLYPDFAAWLAFLADGATFTPDPVRDEFAASIRLTVAPAPWEFGERDEKGTCVGMYVSGAVGDLWSDGFVGYQLMVDDEVGLAVAAPEGIVGLAAAVGDSIGDLDERTTEIAEHIRAASRLSYRNDLKDAIVEDAKQCHEAGFDDLPGGLNA